MNPSRPPAATVLKVPRILVVDDTPDNLFLMNGLFEDRYEVVQAACGREALDVVMSARPPDMILLDIMMPDMDGYEVLRRIRQHPPTANIPIVFLTALAAPQDERLGRQLGAEDYLTKPVDPDEVIRRVDAHMAATAQARRMEALSEKLSRHLAPHAWQQLFQGAGRDSIVFEEGQFTVLHAEPHSAIDAARFDAGLPRLAARHGGTVDRFVYGAAVVFFDQPQAAADMAGELRRATTGLRVGLATGICDRASFTAGQVRCSTLLGSELVAAARAAGAVQASPEIAAPSYKPSARGFLA